MSTQKQPLLFVGGYSPVSEPSLHAFRLDEATGALTLAGRFSGVVHPGFLAVHPNGRWLYAGSEAAQPDSDLLGAVFALRYAGDPLRVEIVNHQDARGAPCHLLLDGTARWALFANYGAGSAGILPIQDDGSLGPLADFVQHKGAGPNAARQEAAHAHSTSLTPDNRFVIVADLGIDQLVIYALDPQTGKLRPNGHGAAQPGSGPRHMAWHPDNKHLYVANELDSSIAVYDYDAGAGHLTEVQFLPTLPQRPADAPDNLVADIHVTHDGKRVMVSNRGHNSLAIFDIGPDARLSLAAIQSCGGNWPRNFQLSPSGRWVLVANERSNEVTVMPLGSGAQPLGEPVARAAVTGAAVIQFAPANV